MAAAERKKNPAAEMTDALPQKQNTPTTMKQAQQQEFERRIGGLIQGKIEPPNEFVGYLIERMKDAKAERDAVVRNIVQMKQRVEALEARRMELEGQANGYLEDIRKWDKPTTPSPVPEKQEQEKAT